MKQLENVISFDFPRDVRDYYHRAGRAGRGDSLGRVFSLIKDYEESAARELMVSVDVGL